MRSVGPRGPLVTRRGLLRAGVACAGTAFGIPLAGAGPAHAARGMRGAAGVTRHPLHIPPVASPVSALTAAPATVDVGSNTTPAWTYNGSLPGPTFRARRGESASIELTNGLPESTTIHWHGMMVPTPADGHPKDAVAAGGSYTYGFQVAQRACMNWYHPHPHGRTAKQVALGLAGVFIVNDAEEDAFSLPGGAREIPVIIRDADFDADGNLVYGGNCCPSCCRHEFEFPLVNGTRDPYLEVDSAVYRLRVLNGANGRVFRLALSDGSPFRLIGNDGGLLETATDLGSVEFGVAERLDLLVDLRGRPAGSSVTLRDARSGWDLLEFRVIREVSDRFVMPTTLTPIPKLAKPVRTRDFRFEGMRWINGRTYDLDRIDFEVPFGEVERWRFITGGMAPHLIHVHGVSFQVVSRSGGRGRVFPWEGGWKDTVMIQHMETVEVLIRFDRFRGLDNGLYLLHCHMLEHEDAGMMSNFLVV